MNLHSRNNLFLTEKIGKNGYYRNECFGLAWDRVEVCQTRLLTFQEFASSDLYPNVSKCEIAGVESLNGVRIAVCCMRVIENQFLLLYSYSK